LLKVFFVKPTLVLYLMVVTKKLYTNRVRKSTSSTATGWRTLSDTWRQTEVTTWHTGTLQSIALQALKAVRIVSCSYMLAVPIQRLQTMSFSQATHCCLVPGTSR